MASCVWRATDLVVGMKCVCFGERWMKGAITVPVRLLSEWVAGLTRIG